MENRNTNITKPQIATKIDITENNNNLQIIIQKNKEIDLFLSSKTKTAQKQTIQILLEENSKLNLTEYSNSSNLQKNITIKQQKNSKLTHIQITKAIKKSKTTTYLKQNSSYKLTSLNHSNKTQIISTNEVCHEQQNSTSDMQIRNISQNKSQITSKGKIKIQKTANHSKAHQKIKSLILDETSLIEAEPILEIENSNVECSHGATISKIPEDILFYINSRGITKQNAQKLIIENYIEETINKIENKEFTEIIKKEL